MSSIFSTHIACKGYMTLVVGATKSQNTVTGPRSITRCRMRCLLPTSETIAKVCDVDH